MIISFHSADHKTGVSQTAQGFAEHLAFGHPDKKILLLHSDCKGSDYFPGVRESVKDIRPFLKDKVLDAGELAEKARCRDNLHIISGDMDFGSRENYTPEMAEYMLRSFEREFDFIICDAGCEADHGLSLGSLFCSDRVYMLIRQSEVCFSRTAWALPLYRQLRINLGALVLCGFEKSSPYTKEYAAERLKEQSPENLGITGSLDILTIRRSRYGSDSEADYKSIYSYGEAGYLKDMAALEEDAAAALGFSAAHRENGRRGLWKNSVSGKR